MGMLSMDAKRRNMKTFRILYYMCRAFCHKFKSNRRIPSEDGNLTAETSVGVTDILCELVGLT
jgi:hypothetical protein